ncbi:MAG: signal recognition particle-docking protein FtsY [Phycisphaerales bacterium]
MGLFKAAISRIKQGLAKTRETLADSFRSIILGRTLDESLILDIQRALLQADVGTAVTEKLIAGLRRDTLDGKLTRGEDAVDYLKREIKALWPPEDRSLRFPPPGAGIPFVILVTGINGAGKTTSIAKLCHELRGMGKSVLLAACDTFRAGAVRQLEIWGERVGVEVVKGQQGGDPAAVAFDACKAALARKVDVLILDTAGRLHTQDPLMRQLSKIRQVVQRQIPVPPGAPPGTAAAPHEVILVLDATLGQNALRQAEEFSKAVDVTGIFLAKLDGTAKGGVVVAIKNATSIPVKFIGVGEQPGDIEPFDPDTFVEAMFEK